MYPGVRTININVIWKKFAEDCRTTENFIHTVKDKATKIIESGELVENAVNMLLFDYQNFPHCAIGVAAVQLMFNRDLRTRSAEAKRDVVQTRALANCLEAGFT